MRIGVDVGGTKIEAIVLGDDAAVVARQRVPTPQHDYEGTLRATAALVEGLEAQCAARGSIGVGIPGAISEVSGLVKNANSTWLIGRPFAQDLARLLQRPVRIANDANCFALSESVDGAGAGCRSVFGVILGTGVGGGIVIDGQIHVGLNGIAGEWGHNPLPWPQPGEWPGPSCYCGRTGCIETFLSGPGLSADFERATRERVPVQQIVERSARGDLAATLCMERYEDRLARALASVINVLDPEMIVLGGGVSNVQRLYGAVHGRWAAYVFSDIVVTRLHKAVHGDSSGVRGAAWLWPASA